MKGDVLDALIGVRRIGHVIERQQNPRRGEDTEHQQRRTTQAGQPCLEVNRQLLAQRFTQRLRIHRHSLMQPFYYAVHVCTFWAGIITYTSSPRALTASLARGRGGGPEILFPSAP